MTIYEADDYRDFILHHFEQHPKKRGYYNRMAQHLGTSPSLITQVMKEQRDFTLDMAVQLIQFFGFSEAEGEHFILLVQHSKAGSHDVKKYFEKKLGANRLKSMDLAQRTKAQKVLTSQQRAIFYSDWYYSAIRLSTSLDKVQSAKDVAEHLDLPLELVHKVLEFLIKNGLVNQSRDGLSLGPLRTHIPQDSELVSRHHKNWRTHLLDRSHVRSDDEFVFTGPTTLSRKDARLVSTKLRTFITELAKIHDHSHPEVFYCLNIDWLKVTDGI